jgi:hypothetical protein
MGPRLRGEDEGNYAERTLSQTGNKAGGGEACVWQKFGSEKSAGKKSRA